MESYSTPGNEIKMTWIINVHVTFQTILKLPKLIGDCNKNNWNMFTSTKWQKANEKNKIANEHNLKLNKPLNNDNNDNYS